MFNLDKAFLNEKAAESDFTRDNLDKVYRLADLLAFIFKEPILSDNLVLKGGTAINLTVFHLPRLSVDDDPEILERIGDHPMALWKCESIRQAQGQKKTQGFSMTML